MSRQATNIISRASLAALGVWLGACSLTTAQVTENFPTIGSVDRYAPELDALVDRSAKIEVLASGFEWTEGPLWVREKDGGYLLFSDIPNNKIFKWQSGVGCTVFMERAGYTGFTDYGKEPGTNGLALDLLGRLLCCEHGDRRVSVVTKSGGKRTVADNWQGKRFNSPNDLVVHSSGQIYFTDPIYGLPEREHDARREVDFCGIYRISNDGTVHLESKVMSRPNGLAFSPSESVLYVANSDSSDPVWRSFPVSPSGALGTPTAFFDSREHSEIPDRGGDGLKVDRNGTIFATGAGGVLVISPQGKLLGRIRTNEAISNVGWGDDGSVLYLTSDMYLCRIKTRTRGVSGAADRLAD